MAVLLLLLVLFFSLLLFMMLLLLLLIFFTTLRSVTGKHLLFFVKINSQKNPILVTAVCTNGKSGLHRCYR